ncbi:MAG: aminopeptidase [Sulfolobales archaeon]|nr:aminopeptidase [Sulfolobales archaeon]MDW7969214.1 aminopeptidase [Sulfolobales archaeon]
MLKKFANLLVNYCINASRGDEVRVSATYEAMPLVRELWLELIKNNAYPHLNMVDEVLDEVFYKYSGDELLRHVSKIDKFIYENVNASISIISSTHTKHLVNVDPERIKSRSQAVRVLNEIFIRRDADGSLRWTVTIFPTKALAQEAGMSLITYEDFLYKALKLYEDDVVSAWRKQTEYQAKIIKLLESVSELRYFGDGVDLTLRVDGRKWINDDGRKNMPGGEVYTAPIEDSVEGFITFTYPAIWRGVEVEGIKLIFKRGVVVDASAVKGEPFLRKILSVDEGSRRVGEIAFGLNYGIDSFTKQILLDEKIGGTIHLALGSAYSTTGGTNRSAIHWDLIRDMRGSKIFADGDLIYSDGKFLSEVT